MMIENPVFLDFQNSMQTQTMSFHSLFNNEPSKRLSPKPLGFAVVVTLLFVSAFSHSATADDSELVYSKVDKFKIPFQFDEFQLEKLGATKIQLHVSNNEGLSWKLHEAVNPDAGKFTYHATKDGKYWFSVRTLGTGGLTYPSGPHKPGLQVIVDTTDPVLKLELTEIEPGKIELQWITMDEHLDVESLELKFLDPTSNQWESVGVRPALRGQTSWTVAKAGLVEARGTIRDSAGNITNIATQTIVAGNISPGTAMPERARPIAASEKIGSKMLSNQPITVEMAITPKDSKLPMEIGSGTDLVLPEEIASVETNSEMKPVSKSSTLPASKTLETERPLPPQVNQTQTDLNFPSSVSPAASDSEIPKPIAPAISSSPAKKLTTTPPKKELVQPQQSKPLRHGHLVNSKTFRIAYELEDVGTSGVSKIELYITENRGKTWFHYGSDNDLISPFVVTVPKDGDYGFVFRIRNGLGKIATPPQPDNKPEIFITVDQSPPQTELLPLQPGSGSDNEILIQWKTQDREFGDNPIALYYATQVTGPWELIEGWGPNTEKYLWRSPSQTAGKFYVRIDVRDAAGNVTRIDGEDFFAIDRSNPKARITDVESLKSGVN